MQKFLFIFTVWLLFLGSCSTHHLSLPLVKEKYASRSITSPADYLKSKYERGQSPTIKAPETVILTYQPSRIDPILEEEFELIQADGWLKHLRLFKENPSVGIYGGFGMGGPVTALHMEALIEFGVRRFIILGTAGGIQEDAKVGEIVLSDRAIRDEGTSHHYLPYSQYVFAEHKFLGKLKKILVNGGIDFKMGSTWTTDAVFRETLVELEYFRKLGVQTVEMEAATVFAVGQYRNVETTAVLVVSDKLSQGGWEKPDPSNVHQSFQRVLRLLVTQLNPNL